MTHGIRPLAAAVSEGDFPRWLSLVLIGWSLFYVLLQAIAVTFVSFAVFWHRTGVWTFTQPGHWLLVSIAVTTAAGVLFALGRISIQWLFGAESATDGASTSVFLWTLTAPENLAAVAINIYIGRKQLPDRQWPRIFYWKSVASILPILGDLGVLHLMQLVARSERRANVQRDIAHRCGFWMQYAISGFAVLLVFIFFAAFASMMFFK